MCITTVYGRASLGGGPVEKRLDCIPAPGVCLSPIRLEFDEKEKETLSFILPLDGRADIVITPVIHTIKQSYIS